MAEISLEDLTPLVSERLLVFLREKFPDVSPSLDWPEREVWFRAGQVSVVKRLAAELERAQAADYEDPF